MRFFSPTAATFTRFASALRNHYQACLVHFFSPTAATFYKICLYSQKPLPCLPCVLLLPHSCNFLQELPLLCIRNTYQAFLMGLFAPTVATFTGFASALRNPYQTSIFSLSFPIAATFYKVCLYTKKPLLDIHLFAVLPHSCNFYKICLSSNTSGTV